MEVNEIDLTSEKKIFTHTIHLNKELKKEKNFILKN